MIRTFQSVRVVKNCKEWDWQKRFPSLESAVDVLLKQLAGQRELLILSASWQKKILQKNNKSLKTQMKGVYSNDKKRRKHEEKRAF